MFGKHAAPISPSISDAIERGTVNLEEKENLDEFISNLQKIQNDKNGRASSINLLNINNGKNTIEFRLANGTINPETWIENIRLYGRIVQMAERLGNIEKKLKSNEEITNEEKRLLDLKERLKSENIPEEEKLEILLDLLFTEEEVKKVYINRYQRNNEELEKLSDEENPLKGLEFAKSVDFRHDSDEYKELMAKVRATLVEQATKETRSGAEEHTQEHTQELAEEPAQEQVEHE